MVLAGCRSSLELEPGLNADLLAVTRRDERSAKFNRGDHFVEIAAVEQIVGKGCKRPIFAFKASSQIEHTERGAAGAIISCIPHKAGQRQCGDWQQTAEQRWAGLVLHGVEICWPLPDIRCCPSSIVP